VISCFDPIRKETARRLLEKLISDGRIHPTRIEELVKKIRKEIDDELFEYGEKAVLDASVQGVPKALLPLLGRLHFRFSFSQNVLKHSIETAAFMGAIAAELGLDEQKARRIGLFHDIGKMGVPDALLRKTGPLTPEEFDEIKKHTLIGEELMRGMKEMESEPLVEAAAEICRWHHERVDGRGYPDGLKGDEIPMTVQAVGLADAYDALVSQRVYKPAYTHTEALAMIRRGECGAFDPLLVDCLEDIQGALCREVYGMRGKE